MSVRDVCGWFEVPGFRAWRSARLAGVLAGVLAAAACGGSGNDGRPQGPPPPVVEVAPVERGVLEQGLSLVGQLEADEVVMLRPETDGVIDEIGFTEGQEVARGAMLFQLRDDWQRARLREAEAQVALTAQAWRRAQTLAGQKILSGAELDEATANRDAARARLDVTRVELERMTIRAPFDGVVGSRLVSPGDRVTDGTDLAQIDAVARLKLAFPLPEAIVDLVRPGMALSVAVAPYPGERFPGTVYFVAPALDPRNRQLLLKAEIPNPDRRLRPGLFATVRLDAPEQGDVLIVPESAVIYDPQGTFVWRLSAEDTAERVAVTLGVRKEGRVEVSAGLAEGDRVVSAGTNKVISGRPVTVVGAAAAKAVP